MKKKKIKYAIIKYNEIKVPLNEFFINVLQKAPMKINKLKIYIKRYQEKDKFCQTKKLN